MTHGYAVNRVIRTLELAADGDGLTAIRLAAELGLHTRTARRILQRLMHDGYLTRKRYRGPFLPSDRLRDLGARLSAE